MIGVDSEVTGLDHRHGAAVFFISTYDDKNNQVFWEWDVDPITRRSLPPKGDIQEVADFLYADGPHGPGPFILQNGKFDYTGFMQLGIFDHYDINEVWRNTHDTMCSGHLLRSDQGHDLTTMALVYLHKNILPFEMRLQEACISARRLAKREFPEWQLAAYRLPSMPSVKKSTQKDEEKPWRNDTWVPRAVAKALNYKKPLESCKHIWHADKCTKCKGHFWHNVLREYGNVDPAVTLKIHQKHMQLIEEMGLSKVYEKARKRFHVAHRIECNGVTYNVNRLNELKVKYEAESVEASQKMLDLAASYDYNLVLPKGSSPNKSLRVFCMDVMKLPPVINPKAKTNNPSLDKKNAIPFYLDTLPRNSKPLRFIQLMTFKRRRDTAISYMTSYEKYGILHKTDCNCKVLYSSLNAGTSRTLRLTSNNPNEQNISKQEAECVKCKGEGCPSCGHTGIEFLSARYCFGPAAGREQWSCDAKNVELRIPAYLYKEQAFIDLFEHPDKPPYYGSNHSLIAHLLHKKKFESCINDQGHMDGRIFKKRFPQENQDTKNGNFAVQYGSINVRNWKEKGKLGTADRTYKIPGAQTMIEGKFVNQAKGNQTCILEAKKHGYVQTLPDREIDPDHGYPLWVSTNDWGKVVETEPLNYKVQGTAMYQALTCMELCQDKLDEWYEQDGFDGFITIQLHDELVFDFPKSKYAPDIKHPEQSNLWRIIELKNIMDQVGYRFIPPIPIPMGVEYHPETWSKGVTFDIPTLPPVSSPKLRSGPQKNHRRVGLKV